MSRRGVVVLASVFFLLYALATTWPGMIPANRIHPLVLGLPFSMFWVALWVTLGMGVLFLAYRVEERSGGNDESEDP